MLTPVEWHGADFIARHHDQLRVFVPLVVKHRQPGDGEGGHPQHLHHHRLYPRPPPRAVQHLVYLAVICSGNKLRCSTEIRQGVVRKYAKVKHGNTPRRSTEICQGEVRKYAKVQYGNMPR